MPPEQQKTHSKPLIDRVLKNSGKLVSGTLVCAVAGLCAMSILIKSLGAAQFGVFVLIQTYAALVADLFTLQCWQAITKYGEEPLAKRNWSKLADILRFGFRARSSDMHGRSDFLRRPPFGPTPLGKAGRRGLLG